MTRVVLTVLIIVCGAAAFGLLMELISAAFSQRVTSGYSVTNQMLAAVGAVLVARLLHAHRSDLAATCRRCGRVHDGTTRWSRLEPGDAPRRVRLLAYTGVVAFVPYIAMKTAWALGATFGGITGSNITTEAERHDAGLWVTLAGWGIDPTALMAVLGGVLLMSLVRPWGHTIPRWVPGLNGRAVPRWLLLAPALLGAATLMPYGIVGVVYAALGTAGVIAPAGDFQTAADALLVIWLGVGPFCLFGIALAGAGWSYFVRTGRRCAIAAED